MKHTLNNLLKVTKLVDQDSNPDSLPQALLNHEATLSKGPIKALIVTTGAISASEYNLSILHLQYYLQSSSGNKSRVPTHSYYQLRLY